MRVNLVQESARHLQMTHARQMRVDTRDLPEALLWPYKLLQCFLLFLLFVCRPPPEPSGIGNIGSMLLLILTSSIPHPPDAAVVVVLPPFNFFIRYMGLPAAAKLHWYM